MLYADVFYIRAELDNDYINRYFEIQQQQRWALHKSTRLGMIALGAVMIACSPWTGWVPVLSGVLTSSAARPPVSPCSTHAIIGGMSVMGASEETINSFSFMPLHW